MKAQAQTLEKKQLKLKSSSSNSDIKRGLSITVCLAYMWLTILSFQGRPPQSERDKQTENKIIFVSLYCQIHLISRPNESNIFFFLFFINIVSEKTAMFRNITASFSPIFSMFSPVSIFVSSLHSVCIVIEYVWSIHFFQSIQYIQAAESYHSTQTNQSIYLILCLNFFSLIKLKYLVCSGYIEVYPMG